MARIKLENVGVRYPLRHFKRAGLVQTAGGAVIGGKIQDGRELSVSALQDISFALEDGDRLGLLGHNGAGKTTLLKVLAGILPPITGRILVEGKIAPLTSIHLGLDDQASGFENIRIRGRLMGVSEEAIDAVLPEIAAFTELDDFLSLPIKAYSSGMRMRLSFAVSTAFQPDIILLDEWLGTGDLVFRDKAARRLRSLIQDSRIFVFATHSRDLHRRLSNKGAVLERGCLKFIGPLEEAFAIQDEIRARRQSDPNDLANDADGAA